MSLFTTLSRIWNRKSGAGAAKNGVSSALGSAVQQLPALVKRLGEPLALVGERLPALSDRSDVLIAESERLLSLATGQQGGHAILKETSQLLEEPLRFLNGWLTEMSSHEEALATCAELLSRMLLADQNLQTTVSPLKHVQTMFKIEAAALSEETRLIFASLTEKIDSVHKRVQDTFIRQFQIVAQSNSEVRQVLHSVRTENGRLQQLIQKHQTELSGSLEKLDREIAENLNRDVQLRDVSQAIAADVYAMVVSLQTQDIVTQKLDHVMTALAEMKQKPSPALGPALRLQAAHMSRTQHQIESTRSELLAAIGRIVESVACVDEKCLRLSEFDEVTAAADGTIQVLLETIANARLLTRSAMELAVQSEERVSPVASTASGLIGALEVLAFEMHLIALNAQIQAVQIGHGTGLEVLAAHTAQVSRRTEDLVSGVAEDVERLAGTLGTIREAFERLGKDGRGHVQLLESSGCDHERKLHSLRDETLEKMRCVGDNSDGIRNAAEELRGYLTGLDTALPEMERLSGELSTAAADAGMTQDLSSLSAAAERYTMQSEVETHQALMGGGPVQQPAADTSSVELF